MPDSAVGARRQQNAGVANRSIYMSFSNVVPNPAAPSSSEQRSPVDLQQLRRFTFADPALDREILELFCSVTPDHFGYLRDASAGAKIHTADQWHLAIHTIKSSAVTIGAWDVADIAVAILDMTHDQITEEHRFQVKNLEMALNEAYGYVQMLLKDL